MKWTDEMQARLVKLAAEGHSAGVIAQMLSTQQRHISRNAVLGRAFRVGVQVGGALGQHVVAKPVKPQRLPKPKGTVPVVPARKAAAEPDERPRTLRPNSGFNFSSSGLRAERLPEPVTVATSKPRRLGLMALKARQCRFILEMEPSPVFCAADVTQVRRKGEEIDSSYCAHHHARCHIKPEGKR